MMSVPPVAALVGNGVVWVFTESAGTPVKLGALQLSPPSDPPLLLLPPSLPESWGPASDAPLLLPDEDPLLPLPELLPEPLPELPPLLPPLDDDEPASPPPPPLVELLHASNAPAAIKEPEYLDRAFAVTFAMGHPYTGTARPAILIP